jgi:hypothetical protein
VPYVDPATPYDQRTNALRSSYRFTCQCILCGTSRARGWNEHVPEPPSTPDGIRSFGGAVKAFAIGLNNRLREDPYLFTELPKSLDAAMHPMYLPALSEAFSKSSHEGPLQDALDVGGTLLALYRVIYPPKFPMIGPCTHFLHFGSLNRGIDNRYACLGDGKGSMERGVPWS